MIKEALHLPVYVSRIAALYVYYSTASFNILLRPYGWIH